MSADNDMEKDRQARPWLTVVAVLGPMVLFVVLRLPALIHQPGMQDEQWFSVPGLTVLQEGIPRIPYLPTRNRETFFENADVCLMALPPGLFYLQAPFFALFPAGYATARIPLFLAALLTVATTFYITRWLGGSRLTAAVAASVVALSRPLLFTGLTVRPDLLCAVCGWWALLFVMKFHDKDRLPFSLVAGGICGLGALFHPLALVYCIQIAGWAMLTGESYGRRAVHVVVMALGTILVLSLWLPLIATFPYEFRSQFFANVVDRAGPGLPVRMIWPFPSLAHHAVLIWEFAGPFQTALSVVALVTGSVGAWRLRGHRITGRYVALVWSSVFLTAIVAGLHPTKGYWVYPFVWAIPMMMVALQQWSAHPSGHAASKSSVVKFTASAAIVLAALLPGGGWKTTWLYLTHWKHPDYYAPAFIEKVLDDLPQRGVFFADLSYVFDVYLSGRETRLCQQRVQYWGSGPVSYDYLLLSWEGEDAGWASQYDARHVRRVGHRDVIQSCFVDIYRPSHSRD